jgi:ABC-type phosphate/phosphonate transport system permease subunit
MFIAVSSSPSPADPFTQQLLAMAAAVVSTLLGFVFAFILQKLGAANARRDEDRRNEGSG